VPIFLEVTKEVSKEVPVEKEEEEKGEEDDVEVSDEEEEGEPETKTVTEKVKDWKRVNEAKALWTRAPKDISQEEYDDFFKTLTKVLAQCYYNAMSLLFQCDFNAISRLLPSSLHTLH
jgi:HSP90 family molecular chaperone